MTIKEFFQFKRFKKPELNSRGWVLLAAIFLLLVCLFKPEATLPKRVYDWYIVLDITQSMNVSDYTLNDRGISRLEFTKAALREGLRSLPCGSRVALGMFTERSALNVSRSVEVCAHYSALDQTIASMDWRMAWAADSFIAHGIYSAIAQIPKLGKETRVLFITDGNQAPPADPKYMPAFEGEKGAVNGFILGAGKKELSPIPKLNTNNEVESYWDQEEVLRYGSFGMAAALSVLAMEQGQHDRNAGHDAGKETLNTAHLSGLDETNLHTLVEETGLQYAQLENSQQLAQVLTDASMAMRLDAPTDLRPWLAWPSLIFILIFVLTNFAMPSVFISLIQKIKQRVINFR